MQYVNLTRDVDDETIYNEPIMWFSSPITEFIYKKSRCVGKAGFHPPVAHYTVNGILRDPPRTRKYASEATTDHSTGSYW